MASNTGISLKGRLRVEMASQFGPLREVATHDFDVLVPARVTGEGSVATIHVDEAALKRMLARAGHAFTTATKDDPAREPDSSIATFCEDVLGLKLDPWQTRVLGEWVASRGTRPVHASA